MKTRINKCTSKNGSPADAHQLSAGKGMSKRIWERICKQAGRTIKKAGQMQVI